MKNKPLVRVDITTEIGILDVFHVVESMLNE